MRELRRSWKTPREVIEEENPQWKPEEEYPMADIQPARQEPEDDVPAMKPLGPAAELAPTGVVQVMNAMKLEFERAWH